jgi:hypothetical protein
MSYCDKYKKYKEKYILLKNQIGGIKLSIIIDTIEFTLIAKNINSGRHVVLISSNKDGNINYFLVYKSNSEIGMWRFYSITGDIYYYYDEIFKLGKTYIDFRDFYTIYKGIDYITHTFIHMDLQMFINNNFHLIPIYEKSIGIDDEDNIIHQYFVTINNKFKAEIAITDKKDELTSRFNIFLKRLLDWCSLNFIAVPFYYYDYFKLGKDIINPVKEYEYLKPIVTLQCGKTRRDHVIDTLEKTTNVTMKLILESKKKEITERNIVSKYYEIINLYLKTIGLKYNIETLKFMYTIESNFEQPIYNKPIIYNHNFLLNVYSIEVNVNDNLFILYFTQYRYIKSSPTEIPNEQIILSNNIYNAIINMVPKTNTINLYGLNNQILSAGLYICKIIAYNQNCLVDEYPDERSRRIINLSYIFVGDYINNMYPLSEFSHMIPIMKEVEIKKDTEVKYKPEKSFDNYIRENDFNKIYSK